MGSILVTGGTGFLGGYLLPWLVDRHAVYAIARHIPAQTMPGIHWIQQDLGAPLDFGALPKKVDTVVHLAQSKHYREFPQRADDIFNVNVQGTFHLLDYARRAGAARFVHASSGGVYGTSYDRFSETDPVNPLSFYLSSKYAAELMVGSYRPFLTTVILRFFFIYGPNQRGMLVPTLLEKVAKGQTIIIDGNPGISLNPIYVDDAVVAVLSALDVPHSDMINVAGGETVNVTELVRLCEEVVGERVRVEYKRVDKQGDLVASTERMHRVLGVVPRVGLVAGLRRVILSMRGETNDAL